MSSSRPSKRQKEVLDFVTSFIGEHGYGPSYREIQQGCGYKSVATAVAHIDALISKGLLRKRDRKARSLEVVDSQADINGQTWLLQRLQQAKLNDLPPEQRQLVYQALQLLGLGRVVKNYTDNSGGNQLST